MRALHRIVAVVILLAWTLCAWAQAPAIEAGGVQNAASNIALSSITPGTLISIKGQYLATSTAAANGYPLPTTLGGATVTVYGGRNGPVLAPLLFASATQVDAQGPDGIVTAGLGGPTTPTIVVTTAAGSSAPYPIPYSGQLGAYPYALQFIGTGALGMFTQDSSGCGQALAYNVHADGSVALNTPQNSLDPEKDVGLTFFLTGLGDLDYADRPLGMPWTYDRVDNLVTFLGQFGGEMTATFGAPGLTGTAQPLAVTYLGPAPGQVGVDQANALGGWNGLPEGCKIPVSLAMLEPDIVETYDGVAAASTYAPYAATQLLNVSVKAGGGVCKDPGNGTLGIVTWQKSTISGVGGTTASEGVSAQFMQSEGLGFPQPPTGAPFPAPVQGGANDTAYGSVPVPPAECASALPSTLNAGALTVSGPGVNNVSLMPPTQNGQLTYAAKLTPGSLQGGTYQVVGQGGNQVGAFTAKANIPAPITGIAASLPGGGTTNLEPGTQLEEPCFVLPNRPTAHPPFYNHCLSGAYRFTWQGGDDRSIVTVQFIVNNSFQAVASAYGSDGSITIPESYGASPSVCGTNPNVQYDYQDCTLILPGNVEVVVTQTPYHAPSQPFSAPGLGLGGESTWNYVWDFRGLSNQ